MPEKPKDPILDHQYDGIQELNNDMPRWWKGLFYFTIVFGLLYFVWFHVLGTGDSPEVLYMKEVNPNYVDQTGALSRYRSPFYAYAEEVTPRIQAELDDRSALAFEALLIEAMAKAGADQLQLLQEDFPEVYSAFLAGGGTVSRTSRRTKSAIEIPENLANLTDADDIAAGSAIFTSQCVNCHGVEGQGGIGPNLTDEYWIHGSAVTDLYRTIALGVPAKGMVAWYGTFDQQQIHQVASYILENLLGTSPPNAKAPEGEKEP
ncbi:cbb3-type cytochrome c oxidase N-terminal domain-containing protein [Candidatus Neomarinimicrobiota bacterium]